jgi:hypothetical protein
LILWMKNPMLLRTRDIGLENNFALGPSLPVARMEVERQPSCRRDLTDYFPQETHAYAPNPLSN